MFLRTARILLFACATAALAVPVLAQQTGSISGKAADSGGGVLPGVTVEARSDVLPGPRDTVTGAAGEFQLPALPPGNYTVTFTLSGMQTVTRKAQVLLSQDTVVNAELGIQGVSENVTVTASASLIDKESATIKSGLSNEQISALPVGQEYRDLLRLIPAVQYSQDTTRGPSAGGSGQDNVYQFDGVNVTLPLFGTLSAEPASHDIAQISIVKGGARAVDFERSGGFSIDSVSKSGTSRYNGQVSYQFQQDNMAANLKNGSLSRYQQDRAWTDVNGGGPILKDHLFFYGSYYRPDNSRNNRANLYGDLPQYQSTRNEGFGKVTFTPTHSVLVNASYRDSKRTDESALFASNASRTTGSGNEARLKIGIVEGSWVVNNKSFVTVKYTDFTNRTQGRPDNTANVTVNTAVGTRLDLANLDSIGLLSVPAPIAGQTAFNDFIAPLITRYGYPLNGVQTGGGTTGYSSLFDNDDFFRKQGQVGYNLTLGSRVRHNIHLGYQHYTDAEDLERSSNGWGSISVPGGRTSFQGTPIFYAAAFQQQTTGAVPVIHSEYRSQSFEVNEAISVGQFSFNLGLLASNDTLYGQGLQNDSSTLSGFRLATSLTDRKYKMYDLPFSKMIQPRLGATWAYNGKDTVYASYATYNPAASSLPRAASWDRNLATTIQAYFDPNGNLFAIDPLRSSSGKLFVDDLTPRTIYETLVGTSKQFNNQWSARLYGRYRSGKHFWEDTNNTARTTFAPPAGIPQTLYISDLPAKLAQIGSGSSYVIAELDGAFTKYYEGTVETEWKNDKSFVRGSYTWSHYYGNFDQDGTTTANDANVFIGSSFIADDAGRQLWNNRYGNLHGDRRHLLKVYGYRALPWHASAGFYGVAQSGSPWEAWSYEPYRAFTTSTSDTARYAEPAGSRLTPSHWQIDLNYTQNVRFSGRYTVQIVGDLFNVLNHQDGYNFDQSVHSSTFGIPRNYYDPRRFQRAFRFQF
ncbi:MAG: carboxypeptidase-like regulatory domain-containing protein [Vicinamibacterales bacterium]